MKTFHLNIKNKRDFDSIIKGKILVYPVEDKVSDFLSSRKFSLLNIWHGPERKKEYITRRWAGTARCDGALGEQDGVVVNIVKCENCIDGECCANQGGSTLVTRNEKIVSCVRMNKFIPMLNQD